MKIRLLSQEDVRRALAMSRVIELMENAFSALSSGEIESPVRTNVNNDTGTLLYKPVLWRSQGTFGIKAVSVFPRNTSRQLPVTTGLMLLNNGETGLPMALMDAQYLTAIRTGAATGLATRLLANQDVTQAALFGTGGQAAMQLEALLCVIPLERVSVFARDPSKARVFCERHQGQFNGNCQLVPTQDTNALKDCGVIVAATTSRSPLFHDEHISSGTHINGIGSFTRDAAEVPAETVARADVFVDQRAAALAEAGDLVIPLERGMLPSDFQPAELGEVLLKQRPGRTSTDKITFFKSVGNAAQDIICAIDVLRTAEREGWGREVEI
ncbi:MAG: hypothetical protein MPJ50_10775 [Pirellulales bacterium]|nr:hypothetical protein [Pirellulales bacterium]